MIFLQLLLILHSAHFSQSLATQNYCVAIVSESEFKLPNISCISSHCNSEPSLIIQQPSDVVEVLASVITSQYFPGQRYSAHNFTAAVIGVVGIIDWETAKFLNELVSRSNLNITIVAAVAPSTSTPEASVPNLLNIDPLLGYIEATISLFSQWNWTRIGYISADYDYYHYSATKILSLERYAVEFVTLSYSHRSLEVLRYIDIQIIVITMEEHYVCSLLEQAASLNLIGPDYAWIVVSHNFGDVPACYTAFDSIFFLKTTTEDNGETMHWSPFSNTLYNSLLAIA